LLHLLRTLPQAPAAEHDEVLFFIERHMLMGRGIGYVDAHLLAAVHLTPGLRLWTRDRRLHTTAAMLGVAHEQSRVQDAYDT
jgi:hypothetical protein